jgi:hypothetical protein
METYTLKHYTNLINRYQKLESRSATRTVGNSLTFFGLDHGTGHLAPLRATLRLAVVDSEALAVDQRASIMGSATWPP